MVVTRTLQLNTQGGGHVIGLNEELTRHVSASGIADGTATVFVTATTAGVMIMELEPGLVQDLGVAVERLVPRGLIYQHNVLNNDTNGHSHIQATLIGQSLVVPVSGGKPLLGVWQSVVLVDFDSRPRTREIVFQIMGE